MDISTSHQELTFENLKKIAVLIEGLFHPLCEVVIHDFADLDHSIIFIQGNITNRSIHGAATDLLIKFIKSEGNEEMISNYFTWLPGGKQMKSSTLFLRGVDGQIYGAFCINFFVSDFLAFNNVLSSFLTADRRVTESFTDDINETIQMMINETLNEMGDVNGLLTKDDKINLICRLDKKGIFQVKHSVTILAQHLNVSRATIYNYLRDSRNDSE